jgi:uncharacterized protein
MLQKGFAMNWKSEWKTLLVIVVGFVVLYFLPVGSVRFDNAVTEALALTRWYAREHVLLCLVPAFFIAGAISTFVSQGSVLRYLGPKASKPVAYGVASVSGGLLAVCSCTILPLFAGIYRLGAGLGAATTFLYSGPAINVMAVVLTAKILGVQLGMARAIGAIVFSVVIGLMMQWIFRKENLARAAEMVVPDEAPTRPLWKNALFFASLVGILIFANWAKPAESSGIWAALFMAKWYVTAIFALALAVILVRWFGMAWWKLVITGLLVGAVSIVLPQKPVWAFTVGFLGLALFTSTDKGEAGAWFEASWGFAKQILPLLLGGVLIAGLLLGRVGHEGLIPSEWIASAVGGNGLGANVFASVVGAFMYFATLTEVPILQGLIGNGMGQGPALTLLLAGPALSLPSMLVIRGVLGTKKTLVFVFLVIVLSTITGWMYGMFFG